MRAKQPYPKKYNSDADAQQRLGQLGNPPDLYVQEVVNNGETKYQIWTGDKPYLQVFWIEIPVKTLENLVLELSNFLAQPIQEKWDGKTIDKILD